MSAPTMARDLRRIPLHCDPVLAPACNLRRRRTRVDLVSAVVWSGLMLGFGLVSGLVLGGVL